MSRPPHTVCRIDHSPAWLAAVVACLLAGCLPAYERGSLVVGASDLAVTDACLELVARPTTDPLVSDGVVLVAYEFGNACAHSVPLDLAAVRVTTRDGAHGSRALAVFDPRSEVGPRVLLAEQAGREVLAYGPPEAIAEMEACARQLESWDPARRGCLGGEVAVAGEQLCVDTSLATPVAASRCWSLPLEGPR